MNLYLDSSALVKRYLSEPGTPETRRIIGEADVQGTTVVSRVEGAAALAKAVCTETLTREDARSLLTSFRNDWSNLFSLQVSTAVVDRAERLAWDEGLRGYDAVRLASVLAWKDGLGEAVTFAAFDAQLWEARPGVTRWCLSPATCRACWRRGGGRSAEEAQHRRGRGHDRRPEITLR